MKPDPCSLLAWVVVICMAVVFWTLVLEAIFR